MYKVICCINYNPQGNILHNSGRVITVSSMMGRFGAPSRSPYACTKWAVQGLSECLRAEMKRWGVHVAIIEPGNFIAGNNAINN